MQDNDTGFWITAISAVTALVVSIATATRDLWHEVRQSRTEVRRDEISALKHEVALLKEAAIESDQRNELCERRCEELREDVMNLLAHIHDIKDTPKRKRKAAAQ